MSVTYEAKDLAFAPFGKQRIAWAESHMPVLRSIRERFEQESPLTGQRIAVCLHITAETANLVRTLVAGGAEVAVCASNPLSTQDDVVASLVEDFQYPVYGIRGADNETYYRHIESALAIGPTITVDDGADLIAALHTDKRDLLDAVIGGTEETTTGVVRERALAASGELRYPVVAVNDAKTKSWFDNRYGTGQSALDGLMRATNLLFAGSTFVMCGYGMLGRGIAARARGLGANVIVTEVDPLHALEAAMEGYTLMPIADAAPLGDIFVTATGNTSVIVEEHFHAMKDGAILANAGHFDIEVDMTALRELAVSKETPRQNADKYVLPDGKSLIAIAEGRCVNLGAAEGHPAAVMDMSFANQALSVEWLVKSQGTLEPRVYLVPEEIDEEIARLKLEAMKIRIDELTDEQRAYLSSWSHGT